MKDEKEYKLIGASLHKPSKISEKAVLEKLLCCFSENCPLLKENFCLLGRFLGRCIYGRINNLASSSTKRGKAYKIFVEENEKKIKNGELPKFPNTYYTSCIILIGDYYYLPYAHMNHLDGKNKIPFLSHSTFLSSGSNFMKKEDFTPKVICEIIKFKPHAMMGGEIKSYQEEEIPKFLFHLKHIFPDLFTAVIKIIPEIEEKVLKINETKDLKCTLADIPVGQKDGYTLAKELTVEKWDGEEITVIGKLSDYPFFLPKFSTEDEIRMIFRPIKKETQVFVKDKELKRIVAMQNPQLIS